MATRSHLIGTAALLVLSLAGLACSPGRTADAAGAPGGGISAKPGSNDARSAAGLAAQLEAIAERLSGVFVEHRDALAVMAQLYKRGA